MADYGGGFNVGDYGGYEPVGFGGFSLGDLGNLGGYGGVGFNLGDFGDYGSGGFGSLGGILGGLNVIGGLDALANGFNSLGGFSPANPGSATEMALNSGIGRGSGDAIANAWGGLDSAPGQSMIGTMIAGLDPNSGTGNFFSGYNPTSVAGYNPATPGFNPGSYSNDAGSPSSMMANVIAGLGALPGSAPATAMPGAFDYSGPALGKGDFGLPAPETSVAAKGDFLGSGPTLAKGDFEGITGLNTPGMQVATAPGGFDARAGGFDLTPNPGSIPAPVSTAGPMAPGISVPSGTITTADLGPVATPVSVTGTSPASSFSAPAASAPASFPGIGIGTGNFSTGAPGTSMASLGNNFGGNADITDLLRALLSGSYAA